MSESRILTIMALSILALALAMLLSGCDFSAKAKDGKDGVSPVAPVISTMPANASECPTGGFEVLVDTKVTAVVCNGLQGSIGAIGAIGPVGPTGSPGQDLTPVTLVQLCPGSPIYPTTFIEYGLCIAGNLWAVYSQNGGFLTYLPPGSYYSNGIGSSCNFTVLPDCSVQ